MAPGKCSGDVKGLPTGEDAGRPERSRKGDHRWGVALTKCPDGGSSCWGKAVIARCIVLERAENVTGRHDQGGQHDAAGPGRAHDAST